MIWGTICQQGVIYKISLISTRCLVLFILIAGILTYNFHASDVVSRVVNMKYESDVKTTDDLIESDKSIGLLDSATIRNYLKVSFWSFQ